MKGLISLKKIRKIRMLLIGTVILLFSSIVFSEPGSSKDPLVSMSYVDSKIEQLKAYIDKGLRELEKEEVGIPSSGNTDFNIINLKRGESIILGEGSELILRSGKALAISRIENGIDNGLCDVTSGLDLTMDQKINENHLLISPRNDGRGVIAVTDTFFIVKGTYEIR